MIYIEESELVDNDFIRINKSIIENFFESYLTDKYSDYTCLNISRNSKGIYKPNTDIVQYLTDDAVLKLQNKKSIVIYFTVESLPEYFPIFHCLHFNCEKYNINPSNVFFLTSNLKDADNYNNFVVENQIKNKISILSYPFFEVLTLEMYYSKTSTELFEIQPDVEKAYKTASKRFKYLYQEKFFSSLSNRNRLERTLGTFLLSKSDFSHKCLISHNWLDPNTVDLFSNCLREHNYGYLEPAFREWTNKLPLTVDNFDFITFDKKNVFNMRPKVLYQSLFHIVNESVQYDFKNNSCAFTEKTYKPILNFQPFVVYGQQHCHKSLEEQGYKLFHNLFDYSFDDEPDPVKRYMLLLKMLRDVTIRLDKLDKQEQINLRLNEEAILKHNFLKIHELYKFKTAMINLFS